MNTEQNTNTESTILRCAEEVFLERGFAGAKTTEIAKRAGVNHAMLHYYFRTKKNLFNVVFQDKLALLATSFSDSFSQKIPFFDKIRNAVETHFDFVQANPRLLIFLYTEVVNDTDRKEIFVKNILPSAQVLLDELEKDIEEELSKGTIRDVKPVELLLNIVALNITTFLVTPFIEVVVGKEEDMKKLMQERRESNVEFILNGLRVHTPKPTYKQTSLSFDF